MKLENADDIVKVRRLKQQYDETCELIQLLAAKGPVKSFRIWYQDMTDLLLPGYAVEIAHKSLIKGLMKQRDEIFDEIKLL